MILLDVLINSKLNTLNTLGKLLLFGLHRSALTNYTLKSLASTLLERDKAAPIYNKLQIPENIEITEIEQEKLQRALNFGYKYRPLKRLRECRSEAITEALQYCGHLCSLPEDRITSLKTQLIPSIEDNNIDIGKVPKIYNFIDIVKLIEQPVTQ